MILEATTENIIKCASAINSGGLVAFPTETVYGLGANAFDEEAVTKIYAVKNRPTSKPLIVHLSHIEQISEVSSALESKRLATLIEKLKIFIPGPISLILPKLSKVPDIVTAGTNTVAIRIPSHPIALKFIKACNCPISAPSANTFNYLSPTSAEHVEANLGTKINYVLDGGQCQIGLESTVLSLINEIPEIVRPGAVTYEKLKEVLPNVKLSHSAYSNHEQSDLSPGMSAKHYSPKTKLIWINEFKADFNSEKIGLITFQPKELPATIKPLIKRCLSLTGDLSEVAHSLFATLRELDLMNLDLILIDSCSDEDLGRAIMDRLKRAVSENI